MTDAPTLPVEHDINAIIGKNIGRARVKKGLYKTELSREIKRISNRNISSQILGRYEMNQIKIPAENLLIIAHALGENIQNFFTDDTDSEFLQMINKSEDNRVFDLIKNYLAIDPAWQESIEDFLNNAPKDTK